MRNATAIKNHSNLKQLGKAPRSRKALEEDLASSLAYYH